MTITFTFSKDTKNALKASANVNEVTQAVVRYMDYFMNLNPRKAYLEHAKMRFAPQALIEKTDLLKEAGVTEEVITPLYEDLAANYAAMHANCWLNDETHSFPQILNDAVGGDRTVLKKIQDTVGNAYATGFDIGHLKQLLTAKESNFRFGGLRKLCFSKKESAVLLDVAKEIYAYVEENFTVRPAVEVIGEITGESTPEIAETVTAVEATYEEEPTAVVAEEPAETKVSCLAEKLGTALLMVRALEAQILALAKEAGVELK